MDDGMRWPVAEYIRTRVFIEGQACPEEEEFDGLDAGCEHFLAMWKGEPAGTARVRTTSEGVKLERYAVLDPFRRLGIGKALVETTLAYAKSFGQPIYMHAQVEVEGLYRPFGFRPIGDIFDEVGIPHRKMLYHSL